MSEENLLEMLSFEDEEKHIIIRPHHYLGSEIFSKVSFIIRELSGEYVSAGKESHFKIPKSS